MSHRAIHIKGMTTRGAARNWRRSRQYAREWLVALAGRGRAHTLTCSEYTLVWLMWRFDGVRVPRSLQRVSWGLAGTTAMTMAAECGARRRVTGTTRRAT